MEHQDVADQHRPDHVDRFTAPRTDPDDPGRAHRATARDAGPDRARGRCGRVKRPDRPAAGDLRGHRPQVASPLVRGTGCGVAGRCEAIGSPTQVHCRASRPGQGDGLHTTPRQGITAVAVVVPGAGRTGDHRRDLRVDIAGDHPPVAVARTRSNRGSTSRGSSSPTQTSPSRRNGCSTSTTARGTAHRWAATTM